MAAFLSREQTIELCEFATIADKEARSDLNRGYIKDENDYTSNFTGAMRRIINSNSQTGLSATSHLLKQRMERRIGGDAAMILTRENASKVAIFEAKWPRFRTPDYRWDYEQTASGLSHFSDQLERQARWQDQFAIFEMFYSEHKFGEQPAYLDRNGSSCVWHDDAAAFKAARLDPDTIWTQDDLRQLLTQKQIPIAEVMRQFGECIKGRPIRTLRPVVLAREFRLPRRLLAIEAPSESA